MPKLRCKLCSEIVLSNDMLEMSIGQLPQLKQILEQALKLLEWQNASHELKDYLTTSITISILVKHLTEKHPEKVKEVLNYFEAEP